MAMVAYRTEPQAYAFGFARDFRDLGIAPNDSLETVLQTTSGMAFGPTDCAVPMTYALEHKIPVDVFCVYTDNDPIRKSRKLWKDNLELSANRAMDVSRELHRRGIEPDRVETIAILGAVRAGADGVAVFGCHEDSCKHLTGNKMAKKRVEYVARTLEEIGWNRERVAFFPVAAVESKGFRDRLAELTEKVRDRIQGHERSLAKPFESAP